MCRLCKENITPEQTIEMLKKTLSDNTEQTFQSWNTTSVQFVLYPAFGIDGSDARELGLELLEKFSTWVDTQPAYYYPKTGIEPMYHPKVIEKLYLFAKNFTNPSNLSKHELFYFISMKMNEYCKEQENIDMYNNFITGFGLGMFIIGPIGYAIGCALFS